MPTGARSSSAARSTWRTSRPSGLRVPTHEFFELRRRSTTFDELLDRYAQVVFGQIAQTAACNRLHGIEARASRWLLQAHDRFGDDQVPLTQASTCCECYGVMRGELERLFPFLQA